VHRAAAVFTRAMSTMRSQNPFLSQTDILWIFFIQFCCADHILSTAGDALTTLHLNHTANFKERERERREKERKKAQIVLELAG
jgi:hypothetical protein